MTSAKRESCVTVEIDHDNFYDTLTTLINLLESRKIDASHVNVSEIVKVYADYLLRSDKMSLGEVAEFLATAAALVLSKVRALFPKGTEEDEGEQDAISDENDASTMEALYPYKVAAIFLEVLHYRRSKHYTRQTGELRPFYEVGDLYFLASLWWSLIGNASAKNQSLQQDIIDLMTEDNPEETIEARMEDIKNSLLNHKEVTLLELLSDKTGKSFVVSTIIALLELARLGIIYLKQRQQFGDIYVGLKP